MALEWRMVPDWPDYCVSNQGDVYKISRGYLLLPADYQRVYLSRKHGSPKSRKTSPGRIVLEAFVGPCPDGMECCHWDDDRLNNKLENVRWGTYGDNIRDAYRNGRGDKSGEKNGASKLTAENVLEAIFLRQTKPKEWTFAKLGIRYGVTQQAVFNAVKGKKWKHLHKQGEQKDEFPG